VVNFVSISFTGLNQQVGNYPELPVEKDSFANYPIKAKMIWIYLNIQPETPVPLMKM
jgi:hypothetical protein